MSEPVRMEDLVPELLEVHRLRGEVREVEHEVRVDGEALPVWAEPARLGHAMLILLGAATRAALKHGGADPVVITLTGDDEWTIVRLALGDSGMVPSEGPWLSEREVSALAVLLGESKSRVLEKAAGGDGKRSVELRIPTLPAVRRREAEGSTSF
jgi:hypothetical protein